MGRIKDYGIYYHFLEKGEDDNAENYLKSLEEVYGTDGICPKCGRTLLQSDLKDYKYLCLACDENFYGIEVETKEEKRERLENLIKYEREKQSVCATSKQDLMYLDSLEEELENLDC